MPDRPSDQLDINPATVTGDPLLEPLSELLAYLDLHLGRYEWRVLTTAQKEMLADLVDSAHVNHPGGSDAEEPWFVPRWWREDWVQPRPDDTGREPDPFLDRPVPPESFSRPDRHALSLARCAVGTSAGGPYELEEQVAVYEWALRRRTPFRNTEGRMVAGAACYPSLDQARTFLAEYRTHTRGR